MNRAVTILEIQKINNYEDIYALDLFWEDFNSTVLGRSQSESKRYIAWLQRKLEVLNQYREQATRLRDFERVEGNTILYSIRYPNSKKNPRIIYFFVHEGKPVLLLAFLEKKPSDYKKILTSALTRYNFVIEHFDIVTGGLL